MILQALSRNTTRRNALALTTLGEGSLVEAEVRRCKNAEYDSVQAAVRFQVRADRVDRARARLLRRVAEGPGADAGERNAPQAVLTGQPQRVAVGRRKHFGGAGRVVLVD